MPTHTAAKIIAALNAEGIECEPHELGLAAHTNDPVAYARALKRCQPTTLRVLTMEGDHGVTVPSSPCTRDAMVCDCPTHATERAAAIKRGRRDVRQPWEAVRRAA